MRDATNDGGRELVGNSGATQGPTSCGMVLDRSGSQRCFDCRNQISGQRIAASAFRRQPLSTAKCRRSMQGAPLSRTGAGATLRGLPNCVRLPSLADGAPEAPFPGGFPMASGASSPAAGGFAASAIEVACCRSPLLSEASNRGAARLSNAPPAGAAKRSAQTFATWFFRAACGAKVCVLSKVQQSWRVGREAFVAAFEIQTFEQGDGSKVRLSAHEGREAGGRNLNLPSGERGRGICSERKLDTRTELALIAPALSQSCARLMGGGSAPQRNSQLGLAGRDFEAEHFSSRVMSSRLRLPEEK